MAVKFSSELIPDREVATEFGISQMSLWRWTHDPNMNFPQKIKINGKNFRSRAAVNAFRKRVIKQAMRAAQKEA